MAATVLPSRARPAQWCADAYVFVPMDFIGRPRILRWEPRGFGGLWRATMDWFIRQQNLERFRRLLAQSPDESERRQIRKLLAEEEAKERAAATRPGGDAAP